MEVFNHNLEKLFEQLGLPADNQAISTFIANHTLAREEKLLDASFWTASQKQFLQEALLQDADWVEQIDLLDTLLRKNGS